MENKLNIILLVAAILFAAAFGYLLNQVLNKPEVISVSSPYPVLIPGKDSIVTKIVFVKDSLKQGAEVKEDTAKASFYYEHVFDDDTLKHSADITYLLNEENFIYEPKFELKKSDKIRIDTLKIPYEIIKEKDVPFFEKPYFNFILGVIASVALFLLGGGG